MNSKELGYEQLAQRGCQTCNISSLDIDLKSRLVSTEELTLSLSLLFTEVNHKAPATWWDRSCDIALLLGTFVHGLGNYDAMLNDDTLPFIYKISKYAKSDTFCCDAQKRFSAAASAAKKVCDDALEASKLKAQKEVQKAVAAAAAASLKREKEAAALREGGDAADAVISNMGEQALDNLYEIQEGNDDHFITLPRMKQSIESSIRTLPWYTKVDTKAGGTSHSQSQKEAKGTEENKGRRKRTHFDILPMPDGRVLDFRLNLLLSEIERRYPDHTEGDQLDFNFSSPKVWSTSDTVLTNQQMRDSVRLSLGSTQSQISDQVIEYAGIGLNGTQCGVTHRTVDDRTDYSIGAASSDLYQVAHGPESPRYLRALGVPMTFGRFGMVALVHADEEHVESMLANERKKFYNSKKDDSNTNETESKPEQISSSSCLKTPEAADLKNLSANGGEKKEATLEEKSSVLIKVEADSTGTPTTGLKTASIIPRPFQDSATLRAGVTGVLLYFGYPSGESEFKMADDITCKLQEMSSVESSQTPSNLVFGKTRFQSLLQDFCGDTELPDTNEITDYIERYFLPHCLKLCLYGNNPTTQITRGSKGEYETYDGTCCYPEPTETLQSPLPDPCLPLCQHSIESVGVASAIIRRVRLMRSIINISKGKVSSDELQEILRSKSMRKSMNGLPVWWCPWVHDMALLAHASKRGLFSIVKDRESDLGSSDVVSIFSQRRIREHIKSTFFETNEKVPQSITNASSPEDTDAWIQRYANEFPSLNVMERRLCFLCAKATEKLNDRSRFDNLPIYDHGGWPRN